MIEQPVFVRAHVVLGAAISFCIAWYSLLVLTSISCPLNFDSRLWTAASSFSTSRRAAWPAAMRSLTAATAAVFSATRVSSACWAARQFRDPAPRAIGGEVEVLELDEMLEIWMHQ